MRIDLKGVLPPLPTPFSDGQIAYSRFTENIGRLQETGLAGYVVLGSNGEAALLSEVERIELIRIAWAEIPKTKLLIVGTGLESTAATCEFTKKAAHIGADAALVVSPNYYRPTRSGLQRHFETVADSSPIPILLYNVPKYTALNMPLPLIAELSRHPNIIGIKDSAGSVAQLVELRETLADEFLIFIGSDGVFLSGMLHGMDGAILALANVMPQECIGLFEAATRQDWKTARGLAARLTPVGRTVVAKYGIPGLKAALDELGAFGGTPRLPLLPLDSVERKEIRGVLQQAGALESAGGAATYNDFRRGIA